MELKVKKLTETAKLPTYGSDYAIGLDLFLDTQNNDDRIIMPGHRKMFHTGIAMEIPEGYYGRVAPRSGLALKFGIDVLAGVVDSDYRGEILVILQNNDQHGVEFLPGEKIAQIILEKADRATVVEVQELSDTNRGAAGLGSTGS
jgi:dUTP pyrophosphatase